ncbi:MAG TPA: hypothetical protein VH914_19155 [Acidimicrobiia bacterium]|nr:hypothetical protein [Acidimicrobiia bacterium]
MLRIRLRSLAAAWPAPLVVGLVAFGCSSTASRGAHPASSRGPTSTVADVHVTATSFTSLKTMTPVRGFFVANLLGNSKGTLAVAHSAAGGTYPVGTVLQLVPQEAMVKHRPGWNPATDDWEFFSLDVSNSGTKILTRGVQNVVNRFGGNCAACHSAAKSKFDFVCEHDHGCAPLPIGDALIRTIQLADPRPST